MFKRYVVGLGTGRCGTQSLSKLLNDCEDSNVSHEFRRIGLPHRLSWNFDIDEINERIEFFRQLDGRLVGDVASYYLNYIPYLIQRFPNLKIIYLIRDAEEVVESFYERTEQRSVCPWLNIGHKYFIFKNYRINDGFYKCFPKFDYVNDKIEAIYEYCKLYKRIMNDYLSMYDNILIVPTNKLNELQEEIFDFLELPLVNRNYQFLWENKRGNIQDKYLLCNASILS